MKIFCMKNFGCMHFTIMHENVLMPTPKQQEEFLSNMIAEHVPNLVWSFYFIMGRRFSKNMVMRSVEHMIFLWFLILCFFTDAWWKRLPIYHSGPSAPPAHEKKIGDCCAVKETCMKQSDWGRFVHWVMQVFYSEWNMKRWWWNGMKLKCLGKN